MDNFYNNLVNDIIEATKYTLSQLKNNHQNENIYAFILYTDNDCYTILPAANSLEMYEKKIKDDEVDDEQELIAYKWSSAEWAYESLYDEKFSKISIQLSEASTQASASNKFEEFKIYVHNCMINALKSLDEGGFFENPRKNLTLFISSSEYDESIEMENSSAKILNPPEIYKSFLDRH
ncbi:DUF4303 domain-containing protein [Lampropedia aestuarii]|uniref:DUF4303 domain-containing protein n=1 Tax=Lampropedia aestuarii TaxID=2562762 RepID=A0A4S5BHJ9_9BURK|nr:DUF4303 domain-containing protein [Lampropedia aestuarii]THJ30303.1 DUF4303 domain-containing protein [Lampropedia aestuarii]